MIDIQKELSCHLTAQQIRDVLDFSLQAADMNGFISSYDYNRSLYVYAAIALYPERQDEIVKMIVDGTTLDAWTALIKDGTIDQMKEDFSTDIEFIAEEAAIWYDDYQAYAHSIRGTLGAFEDYTGGILKEGAEQLFNAQNNSDFKHAYEIAEKWGMNNANPEDNDVSLFIAD